MKKEIMIVDDNADIRYTLNRFLGGTEEYVVVEACDGESCLKRLRKGQIPHLILLDIMMPNRDGWDVAAELKQNKKWKNIPLIFLTAKTDSLSKGLGSITSDDYIEKPFDNEDLRKRIKKVLSMK